MGAAFLFLLKKENKSVGRILKPTYEISVFLLNFNANIWKLDRFIFECSKGSTLAFYPRAWMQNRNPLKMFVQNENENVFKLFYTIL